MKHPLSNVTGVLAMGLAASFAITTIYCIVLLDNIDSGLRHYLSFVDVINLSVYVVPVPLYLFIFGVATYLWMAKDPYWTKWLSIPTLLVCVFPIIYLMLRAYRTDFLVFPPTGPIGLVMGFGLAVSFTVILLILDNRKRPPVPYESIHILLVPQIILVIISLAALGKAAAVLQCEPPDTIIHTSLPDKESLPRALCQIMPLEGGLLLYDKRAGATLFTPWSQLSGLERPRRPMLLWVWSGTAPTG